MSIINLVVDSYKDGHIDKETTKKILEKIKEDSKKDQIAIIGLSVKAAGIENPQQLWETIITGKDCISDFPETRANEIRGYKERKYSDALKIQKGAFLDNISLFDPAFFSCSPAEAIVMQPEQRIFVETAYKALENSGYVNCDIVKSDTGVYVAYSASMQDSYLEMINMENSKEVSNAVPGNLSSVMASRLAYYLDLRGPAVVIDTACSSGLTAVDIASKAIMAGECKMAVVGGVKIHLVPIDDSNYKLGIESEDGYTRAFDENATGTGIGEGAVAVVLKKLTDAEKDGDYIYAVIKGIAVNQDGKSMGITAPNPEAQEDVIVKAWENSGVNPETISYIEAHGTGTKLGDPIEINSINRAFRRYSEKTNICAIGSVKSNVGHLYECAGLMSLAKAILAIQHKLLPATINCKSINPEIMTKDVATYINLENREWTSDGGCRRCGISSFGFSGTNAHLILEEYISDGIKIEEKKALPMIAVFSAASYESLKRLIQVYVEKKEELKSLEYDNFVWNLGVCRKHYMYRLAVIASDIEELVTKLKECCNLTSCKKENGVFYGAYKVVSGDKDCIKEGEITRSKLHQLEQEASKKILKPGHIEDLEHFADVYTKGTDIDWRSQYSFVANKQKQILPEYIFEHKSFWIGMGKKQDIERRNKIFGKDVLSKEECQVGRIISEVLGYDEININDNLMQLGMDSMSAFDIIDLLYEEFGVKIPIKNLMGDVNVSNVASWVATQSSKKEEVSEIYYDKENKYNEFALTFIQRAYQLGREDYNLLGGVSTHMYNEYKTELDFEKLEEAFNKVIKKHPMLHAILTNDMKQKILQDYPYYQLEVFDMSQMSTVECEEFQIKLRNEMSHQIFDVTQWPLFNFKGVITPKGNFIHFGIDMLIADGYSLQIIFRDLMLYYFDTNKMVEENDYTFRDYIKEYQKILDTESYFNAKKYWIEKISKTDTAPELPLCTDIECIKKPHFTRKQHSFGKRSLTRMKEVASIHGVTVASIMATAYIETLRLWCTKEEIVLNLAIFNRFPFNHSVNEIVGDFTSILLLKADYSSELSIWDKIKYVQNTIWEGINHREYDGVELISELSRDNTGHSQIRFPVVFTYVIADEKEYSLDVIGKEVFGVSQTSQVILDNQARAYGDELVSVWDYVDNLFEEDVISRMFEKNVQLISEALMGLEEFSSCEHQDKRIKQYNETFYAYKIQPIIELFYLAADRNRDKIALELYDQSMSYGELDKRSNIVANYLIDQGIGRGDFVGVLTKRDFSSIINILAVLKTAAAYVPIDNGYPEERKQYIYQNNNCKMLLTSDVYEQISVKIEDRPNMDYLIKDIMYTIYTSGSTGNPKGVVETQEAVLNTIFDINRRFHITEHDVLIGVSSLCFDLSVFDVFSTLILGAKLILVKDQRDVIDLMQLIENKQVSVWNSVPAIINLLSKTMTEINTTLRVVMMSGDWIPVDLPDRINVLFINSMVYSLGGATEGAIWSIFYEIKEVKENWHSIPYGIPLSNQNIYILNQSLNECPMEVVGEICIGGVGVAQEYWNAEALTKNAFMIHPRFGYIYRTGDFGKYHRDGYVEFLGRKDSQVKINGYRVELSEIEKRLNEIDGIESAVISAKEQGDYLYSYIVNTKRIEHDSIKNHLKKYLPTYMIPSRIIEVDYIPITQNGKVDRKKLLKSTILENEKIDEFVEPQNKLEQRLSEIFCEVLNIQKISVTEGLFDMGGYSLKAVELMNRLYEEFNKKIDLSDIFKEPTVRGVVKLLSEVEEKRDNLQFPMIKKLDKSNWYATSAAQKRMYLMQQVEIDSIAYNLPISFMTEGKLNEEKLVDIFEELVKRHESFRTSFQVKEGNLVQIIHDDWKLNYEKSDIIEKNIDEEFAKFIRPFDLEKESLLRVKIGRISQEKSVIFIDMHHIISDGVSIHILFEEFLKLYGGVNLKPIELTYKDYVEWNKDKNRTEIVDKEKKYWLDKFVDEIPVLNLYTDGTRTSQMKSIGKVKRYIWEDKIGIEIMKLCGKLEVTPYAFLLSCFNVLLSKYSGQEEVIVGTPIAGRDNSQIEGIIGNFVNTLVISDNVKQNVTYKKYLEEFTQKLLRDIDHPHYQFDDLIMDLDVIRENGRNPLFDIMFTVQKWYDQEFVVDNVRFRQNERKWVSTKFDLNVVIAQENDTFAIEVEYDVDLYKTTTIDRMIDHYKEIVERVIHDPEICIKDIDYITSQEYQIIDSSNNTSIDRNLNRTVIELFEEQVKNTPDRIAISKGDETITYEELNYKANHVGVLLAQQGVKAGDNVVLICQRSIQMIIAIYGILKAGAAYVPVDPSYPKARIDYIIKDCGAAVIITYNIQEQIRKDIDDSGKVIDLSDVDFANKNITNLEISRKAQLPFYVIYTSGTTGQPKGTVIRNDSFVNLLHWYQEEFDLEANDRVLFMASVCFDLAQKNIFTPLTCGAELVIYDIAQLDYEELCRVIDEKKITWINCAPNAFYPIVKEGKKSQYNRIKSIRKVFLGGEPIDCEKLREWLSICEYVEVINTYGPTECTDVVSFYRSKHSDFLENSTIPIGKPIPNTELYVVQNEKICGIGVFGEICITGVGVSNGYINNKMLTDQKFVKNPFGTGYMYHTGDIGIMQDSGNILYMGRMDEQVKINGIRIEIGEIESAIKRQQIIDDCAVVTQILNGNKKIIAYLVSEEELNVRQLRETLRNEIPTYMMPAVMMQIKSIPITGNGKLDKRKLPDVAEYYNETKEVILPESVQEKEIAVLFKQILHVDQVSVTDTLFDLGGDSLKAIQLISALKAHNVTVSLSELINNVTIREVAERIGRTTEDDEYKKTSRICQLTPIMRWYFDKNDKDINYFNQGLTVVAKQVDVEILDAAIREVVYYHDILRAIYSEGKLYIRRPEEGKPYILHQFNIEIDDEKGIREFIEDESNKIQQSINLITGPMVHVGVFLLKNETHILFVFHHLVMDLVSLGIVMEDILTLYIGKLYRCKVSLPQKTVSYAEWADALNMYSNSERLMSEVRYWNSVLEEAEDAKIFSINKEERNEKILNIRILPELTEVLLQNVRNKYKVEMNEILMTAIGAAVKKITGKSKLAMILEGHGRENIDQEINIYRTVGWFTSLYPIIIETDCDIIQAVKMTQAKMNAVPNKGNGYLILKYNTQNELLERDIDIFFNYRGTIMDRIGNQQIVINGKEYNSGEIFKQSKYSTGNKKNPQNSMGQTMSFECYLMDKSLNIEITYDSNIYEDDFIKYFEESILQSLEDMVNSNMK